MGAFERLIARYKPVPFTGKTTGREGSGDTAAARPPVGLLCDPHQLPWEEEKQIFFSNGSDCLQYLPSRSF